MFNLIKFKIINVYGVHSNFLYNRNKFYEVKCEPSYQGDVILLCNKNNVTFEEVIKLLLHTLKKVNILGAISLVYYKYSSEFLDYLKQCSQDEYKKIKRKCRAKINNLNSFIAKSDDLLFPQNSNIREIHQLFKYR
ncbi:MAG: hypothetical protein IKJ19_07670 [Clostridia bacterium]|nr:hypothetical protein [Clostridia bacterium]